MPNTVDTYKNGRLSKRHKEAHIDDLNIDKSGVATFKHNKKIFTGLAFLYNDKQERIKSTFYSNGYKHGTDASFYNNSYPHTLDTYENGKLSGPSTRWDKSGYIVNEAYYKDGLIDGEARSYYSLVEMDTSGHVFTDVAWSANGVDLRGYDHTASDMYKKRGTAGFVELKDINNKHIDYVVAVYRSGVLYTDMSYSTSVMSHPSIGFTRRLPIKSITTMKNGLPNGLETTYYPNGHKFAQGQNINGKRDKQWNMYHAWRPNNNKTDNILLKTQNYNKGMLDSERVFTTNEKLNTYAGKEFSSSYKLDMGYVTGGQQAGVCFNCSKVQVKPEFEEGFELRRSKMYGILPSAISKVAQEQTTEKVYYKNVYKEGEVKNDWIHLDANGSISNKPSTKLTKSQEVPKRKPYSRDSITGGSSFYGELNTGEVKFLKFSLGRPSATTVSDLYVYDENRFNIIGMDLEKYIARESKKVSKK
jgi:antitoxin component YwqK of YwqJK toxin-antitoxin module